MNESELRQEYINLAISIAWFICIVVSFLKGKKWTAIAGIIASILTEIPIAGMYWHRIITQPLIYIAVPAAAIRLARPNSFWSHWFYRKNPVKMLRAVDRFQAEIDAEINSVVEEIKARNVKTPLSEQNAVETSPAAPTQLPTPPKNYYDGKKPLGLFQIQPGETKEQFSHRVWQATNGALAKDCTQPPTPSA